MADFKDHFSGHAEDYAAHRPRWPTELFRWLSDKAPHHDLAWDCATGNGQAAIALAAFFRSVFASDASRQQIKQAHLHSRVRYGVEPAESTSLASQSVDLIVVAQAFHWFDQAAFLNEAQRVLRPGGLLAIMIYQLAKVDSEVERAVHRLYDDILDDYWPSERDQVERGLDELNLPYPDVETPEFELVENWSQAQLVNYLGTWSAVRRYRKSREEDPITLIMQELATAWGDASKRKPVVWPVRIRVCQRPD